MAIDALINAKRFEVNASSTPGETVLSPCRIFDAHLPKGWDQRDDHGRHHSSV